MCIDCTNMLNKPWVIGSEPARKPRYKPVEYCTYWPLLGSFNNWKIIQFTNKATEKKDIDAVKIIVFNGISDNMSALSQN